MGGLDLFDQFMFIYRVRIGSKKWWWRFFVSPVNASMANPWNFFGTVQKEKNWNVRFPKRDCHDNFGIFWRDKPAKSLAFPRYVASNVKLDTENHILWKDATEYCCCKHCGGRSIHLCQKWNFALHRDSFKDDHSWNTYCIVSYQKC